MIPLIVSNNRKLNMSDSCSTSAGRGEQNFMVNAFLGMENGQWMYGTSNVNYTNWKYSPPGTGNAVIHRDNLGQWITTTETASTICLYYPLSQLGILLPEILSDKCKDPFFYSRGLNLCLTVCFS